MAAFHKDYNPISNLVTRSLVALSMRDLGMRLSLSHKYVYSGFPPQPAALKENKNVSVKAGVRKTVNSNDKTATDFVLLAGLSVLAESFVYVPEDRLLIVLGKGLTTNEIILSILTK